MARLIGKRVRLLGGMVVLILISILVGYWLVWRYWSQTQTMMGDRLVRHVGATALGTKTVTYNLVEGWNMIAFPMEPITIKTASELVKDVGDVGGHVTVVSRWNGDRWQELAVVGDEEYGQDFMLKPGEAYFIQNHQAVEWRVVGNPVVRDDNYGKVILHPGWNAIGLNPITVVDARDVLDTISKDGGERASEIDKWYSGNWQMLVKRWYSPEDIQEYGDNFKLEETQGYMIRATDEILLNTAE